MIPYRGENLDSIPIFTSEQLKKLNELNNKYSLRQLMVDNKNFKNLSIDFIHASSQIEGNTYTRFETEELLERGRTSSNKQFSDALMIVNLRDTFEALFAQDMVTNSTTTKTIHALLTDKLLISKERGIIRTTGVTIGGSNYIPLSWGDQILTEFNYLHKKADSIHCPWTKALYLHLNLAYLQPFVDGNKRTARMVQTKVLIENDKVPLLFNYINIGKYVDAVIKYYETGESENYVTWFFNCYLEMYQRLLGLGRIDLPDRNISEDPLI